jgi:type I restriction enzyme R subunit
VTEDQLEQETLAWLADVGWQQRYGPELAPDGLSPERANYRQVLLVERLRQAITRLNPDVPPAARDDALRQVLDLGTPALLAANRLFHRLLVGGVPVQYPAADGSGELLGDRVRLIDWATPAHNEWLAVNQFSITGPRHTRRPDIVLFVNGLPLVIIELKNPADAGADVWKAFHQLQTYKAQIGDVFAYNELLVISDGSDALLGSLSADAERYMGWRTIDGVALDPLGPFNELQSLVRGVLAPALLLEYLRFYVLFEDGTADAGSASAGLVKKIAGYHQFHAVRAAIAR